MPKLHILNLSFDDDVVSYKNKSRKGKFTPKFKLGDDDLKNKKIKKFDRTANRSRKESFIFEK